MITFGWNTQFVIQLAIQQAIGKRDVFLLILPSGQQDPKTLRAIKTLEDYFYGSYSDVEFKTYSVNVRFFRDGVLSILDKINYYLNNGYEVYVNISGGMRILCLVTYTAAIIARHFHARGKLIKFTPLVVEGLSEDVHLFFPPVIPPKLGEKEKKVLLLLYKKRLSVISDIATELGMAKATVLRIINKLDDLFLVSKEKKDKKTIASITDSGILYVDVMTRYHGHLFDDE